MATNEEIQTVPAKFLLENVYEHLSKEQNILISLNIGSSPRTTILKDFTPELDQLLPMFILKEIETTSRPIRIIHLDHFTERSLPFLHEYFLSYESRGLNFKHDSSSGINIWKTDDNRIEIIFLFVNFYHSNFDHTYDKSLNDRWFLEHMIDLTFKSNSQLIVQQYTGYELTNIFKDLYQKNNNKELFKNKILFDITYGIDCGCMTDMSKFYPIYMPDGNFCNILLYDYDDFINIIGINDKINDTIKNYFLKQYKNDIDNHHINYRRKIIGDTLLYTTDEYNESSSPELIMDILIGKLQFSVRIFEMIGLLNIDKIAKINDLFSKYKSYEMYEWRKIMLNILE